ERGEIDDAVDDGGGAGDRAVHLLLPEDGSRRRVEGVEVVVVRAYEDAAMPDGRRAVHEAAGVARPAQLAAPLAVRGDVAVGRAEIDARVRDGRGRVELTVPTEEVALRFRTPEQLAVARPQRIEVAVVGTEEDVPAVVRDRALHGSAHVVLPDRVAI